MISGLPAASLYHLCDLSAIILIAASSEHKQKRVTGLKMGTPEAPAEVEVVDCPGHQKLRAQSLSLVDEAKCVVYVVDCTDKQRVQFLDFYTRIE